MKRSGLKVLGMRDVNINLLRSIWSNIPQNGRTIDRQVEIDAHYSGYLLKQNRDIESFTKDGSILIPDLIDYDSFSGLSNEVKSKLKSVRPKTLGQALRIDGITPAAAIILLGFIKKSKKRVYA